jgi:hypothetical protein
MIAAIAAILPKKLRRVLISIMFSWKVSGWKVSGWKVSG